MWQSFKFQAERDDEIESVSSCWTPPVFQAALSTRKFKKKKKSYQTVLSSENLQFLKRSEKKALRCNFTCFVVSALIQKLSWTAGLHRGTVTFR